MRLNIVEVLECRHSPQRTLHSTTQDPHESGSAQHPLHQAEKTAGILTDCFGATNLIVFPNDSDCNPPPPAPAHRLRIGFAFSVFLPPNMHTFLPPSIFIISIPLVPHNGYVESFAVISENLHRCAELQHTNNN